MVPTMLEITMDSIRAKPTQPEIRNAWAVGLPFKVHA